MVKVSRLSSSFMPALASVSEARKDRYEKDGVPVPSGVDGTGGRTIRAKTKAPPVK